VSATAAAEFLTLLAAHSDAHLKTAQPLDANGATQTPAPTTKTIAAAGRGLAALAGSSTQSATAIADCLTQLASLDSVMKSRQMCGRATPRNMAMEYVTAAAALLTQTAKATAAQPKHAPPPAALIAIHQSHRTIKRIIAVPANGYVPLRSSSTVYATAVVACQTQHAAAMHTTAHTQDAPLTDAHTVSMDRPAPPAIAPQNGIQTAAFGIMTTAMYAIVAVTVQIQTARAADAQHQGAAIPIASGQIPSHSVAPRPSTRVNTKPAVPLSPPNQSNPPASDRFFLAPRPNHLLTSPPIPPMLDAPITVHPFHPLQPTSQCTEHTERHPEEVRQ